MTTRYWIRPTRPEAVEWRDPPEWIAGLMEVLGYCEVDESAFRTHVRTEWRARERVH